MTQSRQKNVLTSSAKTMLQPALQHNIHASFILLFILMLCFLTLSSKVHANPFTSSGTPGMFMAHVTFNLNKPSDDRLLSPDQLRLKIMNSAGKDMIYLETPLSTFNPSARFAYSRKDGYTRPENYPHNRDTPIIDKPTSYMLALERYQRAIHLYKTSPTYRSKQKAKAYMVYCYKQALALYDQGQKQVHSN